MLARLTWAFPCLGEVGGSVLGLLLGGADLGPPSFSRGWWVCPGPSCAQHILEGLSWGCPRWAEVSGSVLGLPALGGGQGG